MLKSKHIYPSGFTNPEHVKILNPVTSVYVARHSTCRMKWEPHLHLNCERVLCVQHVHKRKCPSIAQTGKPVTLVPVRRSSLLPCVREIFRGPKRSVCGTGQYEVVKFCDWELAVSTGISERCSLCVYSSFYVSRSSAVSFFRVLTLKDAIFPFTAVQLRQWGGLSNSPQVQKHTGKGNIYATSPACPLPFGHFRCSCI